MLALRNLHRRKNRPAGHHADPVLVRAATQPLSFRHSRLLHPSFPSPLPSFPFSPSVIPASSPSVIPDVFIRESILSFFVLTKTKQQKDGFPTKDVGNDGGGMTEGGMPSSSRRHMAARLHRHTIAPPPPAGALPHCRIATLPHCCIAASPARPARLIRRGRARCPTTPPAGHHDRTASDTVYTARDFSCKNSDDTPPPDKTPSRA